MKLHLLKFFRHKIMQYKYRKLPLGTIEKSKRQVVFICIYTKKSKPFANYEYASNELKQQNIPLVLMLLRQDGSFGFPGGTVDPGEDLITALCREVMEEINYELDVNNLKPLTTFSTMSTNIHSYSYEVEDESKIKSIQRNALNAPHFLSENGGCVLQQIISDKGKGYPNFLKNNFCSSARIELEELVKLIQ